MSKFFKLGNRGGVNLELSLIITLIAIASVVGLIAIGLGVNGVFTSANNTGATVPPAAPVTLSGTLVNSGGTPWNNVSVFTFDAVNNEVSFAPVVTDSSGNFNLVVPPGTYIFDFRNDTTGDIVSLATIFSAAT